MLDLTTQLELPRARLYPNPRTPGQCLPLVWGDMSQGGEGGLWETVCLDTTAFVYALAGHPLVSPAAGNAITLYDGQGQQISPADYTLNLEHDYQGLGSIAIATFAADASGREPITARGKGRPGTGGELLQNPVDIIEQGLRQLAGASEEDWDPSSLARSRARAAALGYAAAGVMTRDAALGDWLTDLASNFLASWWLGGDGRLKLFMDLGAGSLDEGELTCVLRPGDLSGVSVSASLDDMVNLAPLNYCLNPASGEYEEYYDGLEGQDLKAQGLHGLAKQTLELSWVRRASVAATISQRLVALLGRPRRTISCQEGSLSNLVLEKGDTVLFSLPWLQDPQGRPLKNQIVRVLGLELDLDAGRMGYTLLDTGFYKTLAQPADGSNPADGRVLAGGERDLTEY